MKNHREPWDLFVPSEKVSFVWFDLVDEIQGCHFRSGRNAAGYAGRFGGGGEPCAGDSRVPAAFPG